MRWFITALLVLVASCGNSKSDELAVREMFVSYQSALLRDDGSEAVNYLSQRTIDYYAELLEHARLTPEDELRGELFMDRFTVLRLRSEFDSRKLSELSGEEVLEYAIEEAWIDKEGTALFEVQQVRIRDDFAAITFTRDGIEVPVIFEAYRESGSWKLDLTSVFAVANYAFVQQIEDSGLTEDEFIDEIFKALGHSDGLTAQLWMPAGP